MIPIPNPLTSILLGWRPTFCRFRTFALLKGKMSSAKLPIIKAAYRLVGFPRLFCRGLHCLLDKGLHSIASQVLQAQIYKHSLVLPSPCFLFEFHSPPGCRRHRAPLERVVPPTTLTHFIYFAGRIGRLDTFPRPLSLCSSCRHSSPTSFYFEQMPSLHDKPLPKRSCFTHE